jgi:diguanylate cyclase (GGDEF)-like protein
VFAFVDVDGLKAINDGLGHAAGDQTLREVATVLRSNARPYDVVIRYGGDEFLCVFANEPVSTALERFALVKTALAAGATPAAITVGIAELQHGESLEDSIRRADAELYRDRRHQRGAS